MLKKFLTTIFIALTSIQAYATDVPLHEVLKAAPRVSEFVSSASPLQFGEPLVLELAGEKCSSRWFFYNNKEDPQMTFGDLLTSEKKLQEKFNTDARMPGAMFIQASDAEKARGISYVLSLSNPNLAELPTIHDVLKASQGLRHYAPSPLVYPASPQSIVEVKGVRYQIRYCKFFDPKAEKGKDTLGAYVKANGLQEMFPVARNNGYGEYFEYNIDQDHQQTGGPKLVISMARVE